MLGSFGTAQFPGTRGGPGKADALMTKAVRESVTMAGRAERARVAGAFTAGVLGPGTRAGMTPRCR